MTEPEMWYVMHDHGHGADGSVYACSCSIDEDHDQRLMSAEELAKVWGVSVEEASRSITPSTTSHPSRSAAWLTSR